MTGTRGKPRASVAISEPSSAEELEAYFAFRWKLLRAPWNQPPGSERDEFEAAAHHLIGRNRSGEIVAVGRIHFPSPSQAQIRYMATREDFRRLGIGSSMVERLEQLALDDGIKTIVLNARTDSVPFYERLGYTIHGQGPTLFGIIEHKTMTRTL